MCERRYRMGEQWYNLKPDALAEYRKWQQQMRFWLEWDRGTMNVRDLVVKFHAYAHYDTSRDWARETLSLPSLFSIVPDIAQERRMQRVAQGKLAHIPGLVLWTTTEVLFHEQGPLATIWLRGIPQPSQASQTEGAHRQGLFDAILAKYCMRDLAQQFLVPCASKISGRYLVRPLATSNGAYQDWDRKP